MPGLLFQPLLRHGNHAMRQSPVKGQLVVQQDMEQLVRTLSLIHDIARWYTAANG